MEQAYRHIEPKGQQQGLSRAEVRKFFDAHGAPSKMADKVFNHLNHRNTNAIDFDDFRMVFDAAMGGAPPGDGRQHRHHHGFHGLLRPRHSAGSLLSIENADQAPKNMSEERIRKIARQMSSNAQARFCDKSQKLSRQDMQHMFEAYGLAPERGNELFDRLDTNRDGEVPFRHFSKNLASFLDCEDKRASEKQVMGNQRRPGDINDEQLLKLCDHVGQKASQKARTVQKAFRFVDVDFDGKVDRHEVRNFFRNYGSKTKLADKFFDRLDPERSGYVDFGDLKDCFAPFIQPGYHPPVAFENQRGQTGLSEWGGQIGLANRQTDSECGYAGKAEPRKKRTSRPQRQSVLAEDELRLQRYGRFDGTTTYAASFTPDLYSGM